MCEIRISILRKRLRVSKSEKVHSMIWGLTRKKNGCFSLGVEVLSLSKEIAIDPVSSAEKT